VDVNSDCVERSLLLLAATTFAHLPLAFSDQNNGLIEAKRFKLLAQKLYKIWVTGFLHILRRVKNRGQLIRCNKPVDY